MKEIVDEIYTFMKSMIDKHGVGKLPPQEYCKMVDLHNKFFNTNKSCHNMNDLKLCYTEMKALYHKIRTDEIVYEEESKTKDILFQTNTEIKEIEKILNEKKDIKKNDKTQNRSKQKSSSN